MNNENNNDFHIWKKKMWLILDVKCFREEGLRLIWDKTHHKDIVGIESYLLPEIKTFWI